MNPKKSATMLGMAAAAMSLGAGLMYVMDPMRGGRRRAMIRDKAFRMTRAARETLEKTTRDFENRAAGLRARLAARFRHEEQASDEVLLERVRSHLGHLTAHPETI